MMEDLFTPDLWDDSENVVASRPFSSLPANKEWQMPEALAHAYDGLIGAYHIIEASNTIGLEPSEKDVINLIIKCKSFAKRAANLISDSDHKECAKMLLRPQDISISPLPDGLKITWKGKLPKIKTHEKNNYPFYGYLVEAGLTKAIQDFRQDDHNHLYGPENPAFIKMTHIFKSKNAERDYDNNDLSEVFNALKKDLFVDDSPSCFSFYQDSKYGKENGVELIIVSQNKKSDYI